MGSPIPSLVVFTSAYLVCLGYSPPPAESMIRCTKTGPIVPVVSHEHQDQITPSQMQLEQPQQKTGGGPLSSTQPEPSHSQADVDGGTAGMLCQARHIQF